MAATSSTPQVRSLRKANNDQVAIAIDEGPASNSRLEDEDDDKGIIHGLSIIAVIILCPAEDFSHSISSFSTTVHGFKSLTTSRIVPKFTRPLTDMVDGLW